MRSMTAVGFRWALTLSLLAGIFLLGIYVYHMKVVRVTYLEPASVSPTAETRAENRSGLTFAE